MPSTANDTSMIVKQRGATHRVATAAIVLAALLVVCFALSMIWGAAKIPLSHVTQVFLGFGAPSSSVSGGERVILMSLRLPRSLLAMIAGGGLALAGALMQGLFRNPLASPYLLGVANGASTGAAIMLLLGLGGPLLLPLGAFGGALLAAALVLGLVRVRGRYQEALTIILAGIAIGSLFSAITALIVFRLAGSDRALEVVFWMMGGLGRSTWPAVLVSGVVVLVLGAAALPYGRELDALLVGEQEAEHIGVPVGRTRILIIVMAAMMTAAPMAFVGTIGFVGLVTPHLVRMAVGVRHRSLLPLSALAGAVLLLAADTVARVAVAPAELPVGVVTAFFGVPFFLFLLWKGVR
jgi:iron complex transport system permease protein